MSANLEFRLEAAANDRPSEIEQWPYEGRVVDLNKRIILTVGMAVDANVLIFSRIREELKSSPPAQAIGAGYDRAFLTILDANVTTLFVALILLTVGSGPIAGFAVTLSIGILTSMFTAIFGSRLLVHLLYGLKRAEKVWI